MSNFNSKSISESTPSQDMPEPKYAVGDIMERIIGASRFPYTIVDMYEGGEHLYRLEFMTTRSDVSVSCNLFFQWELDRNFKKVNYKKTPLYQLLNGEIT